MQRLRWPVVPPSFCVFDQIWRLEEEERRGEDGLEIGSGYGKMMVKEGCGEKIYHTRG